MFIKKMLRDMRKNLIPFVSLMILAMVAMAGFTGLSSSNIGMEKVRAKYHKDTVLADYWVYGKSFNKEQLEKLTNSKGVEKAQFRTQVETLSTDKDYPITLFIEDENKVSKPLNIKGAKFDPKSEDGIWINSRYAEANKIKIGDEVTLRYNGFKIREKVKGLMMMPEFEYYKANKDSDPDFKDIGYAYIGKKVFLRTILPYGMDQNFLTEEQVETFLPNSQILIKSNESRRNIEKSVIDAIGSDYMAILEQKDQGGIQNFTDEIEQHKAFAVLFPMIFLLTAIMVMVTTMSRVVMEQRVQIGTMKALGVKRKKIIRHYMFFGFFLSAIGTVIGALLGPKIIGEKFLGLILSMQYTLPSWITGYSISFAFVAILIIGTCTATAYLSTKKIIKLNTRDILYPRAPKTVRKCVFEYLPFWNKFSFATRYNLRNFSRNKGRNLMVAIGIAGSMVLVLASVGCMDTLAYMKECNFSHIQNFKYEIRLSNGIDEEEAEKIAKDVSGDLLMLDKIQVKKKEDGVSKNTNVTVLNNKDKYRLIDVNLKEYSLKEGDIAVSRRFADQHGFKNGDTIYWKGIGSDKWIKSKISLINWNMSNQGLTILKPTYIDGGGVYHGNVCLSDKNLKNYKNDNVSAVISRNSRLDAWDNGVEIYELIILSFIVMALIIMLIVIYNSAVLAFNERNKEFATLKVLGIKKRGLRKIIISQNIWMTVVGGLLGIPLGKPVLNQMFVSNGGGQDFLTKIYLKSYFISFIAVLIVSLIVNYIFTKKMKKIDMVESMKANE